MTTDDQKELTASQDFNKLQQLLGDLVGQPCLRAEFSYGEELVIRFGEGKPHKHPKLAGVTRGAWELSVLASPWSLYPDSAKSLAFLVGLPFPSGIHLPRVDRKIVEDSLARLTGSQVQAVKLAPSLADLSIQFSNAMTWQLLSKYAEPDPELPIWELATPYGMFIQVFGDPLPTWSYLCSDVPMMT